MLNIIYVSKQNLKKNRGRLMRLEARRTAGLGSLAQNRFRGRLMRLAARRTAGLGSLAQSQVRGSRMPPEPQLTTGSWSERQ